MDTDGMKKIIESRVASRLSPLRSWPHFPKDTEFWVAGGCLIRGGSDVDLFCPIDWPTFPADGQVFFSKNAVTYDIGGELFQFCRHKKPTLMELLQSFDFAHCQIGCKARVLGESLAVYDVQWTTAYGESRIVNASWFTGSEYPLSSLIRVAKYRTSGIMSNGSAIRATIDALAATVKRGFKDYGDFKDQLDAVDLGLVPEDLNDVERSSLLELFNLLHRPS